MEQEQQEDAYRNRHQQQQFDASNVPYQPRVRRSNQPQQQQGQGASPGYGSEGTRDANGAAAGQGIEEQFNKLAVQGKAAVSNFLSSAFVKNVKDRATT